MIYFIMFLILAGLLVIILMKMKNLEKQKTRDAQEAFLPQNATLKDVGVGGVITIEGFSDDYRDLDFVVEKVNRYEQRGFSWFELVGTHANKKLYLEWEFEEDAFFVTATTTTKGFRLSKLNLAEEMLEKFDEDKSRENSFQFNGETYSFEESGEIIFYENNRGPGEGYYNWDFINESQTKIISIEKWEDEPFEAFLGSIVDVATIQILKVK